MIKVNRYNRHAYVAMFLFILMAFVAWGRAWGCAKNQTEWEGVCTVDIKPEAAPAETQKSWVSDEKPPKTTTGEWQTDKVKIVNLTAEVNVDDEINSANKWDAEHGEPPKGVEK